MRNLPLRKGLSVPNRQRRFILIEPLDIETNWLNRFTHVLRKTRARVPTLLTRVDRDWVKELFREHPNTVLISPEKAHLNGWASVSHMFEEVSQEFPHTLLFLWSKLLPNETTRNIGCHGIIRRDELDYRKLALLMKKTQSDWPLGKIVAESGFILSPR